MEIEKINKFRYMSFLAAEVSYATYLSGIYTTLAAREDINSWVTHSFSI